MDERKRKKEIILKLLWSRQGSIASCIKWERKTFEEKQMLIKREKQ